MVAALGPREDLTNESGQYGRKRRGCGFNIDRDMVCLMQCFLSVW